MTFLEAFGFGSSKVLQARMEAVTKDRQESAKEDRDVVDAILDAETSTIYTKYFEGKRAGEIAKIAEELARKVVASSGKQELPEVYTMLTHAHDHEAGTLQKAAYSALARALGEKIYGELPIAK